MYGRAGAGPQNAPDLRQQEVEQKRRGDELQRRFAARFAPPQPSDRLLGFHRTLAFIEEFSGGGNSGPQARR